MIALETAQLILKEPQLADVERIVHFLTQNQSFHQSYEPIRPQEYYTDAFWQAKIKAREPLTFNQKGCHLFFSHKCSPTEIIGFIHFDNIIRGCFQSCTLGYALAVQQQGKGFMHEALKAGIQFIFDHHNLHRIQANYLITNTRSAHLLKKLGFSIEGQAKEYLRINGQWQDHVLSSLINTSWQDK